MPHAISKALLISLLETQAKLDAHIHASQEEQVSFSDEWTSKLIALRVEYAEFLNEGQWFKLWKKNRAPKEALLEEFVDILHFLLSIGNDIHADTYLPEAIVSRNRFGDGTALEVLDNGFIAFGRIDGYASWHWAMEYYLAIGEWAGFTMEQIVESYMSKNKVNHQRQEEGY